MIEQLDQVLLGDNVVEEFFKKLESEEFCKWINNILPEVSDCKNLEQDNPWHIYNCLEHILHSVEAINEQTKGLDDNSRRILAYTMFLHDIGKPECKIRRYSKLYKKEVDSFFGHNKASMKIANRVLPQFGFDQIDIDQIKMLIEEHDMFMFITLNDDGNRYHKVLSHDVINEQIAKFNSVGDGRRLMEYLIMVGRADNLAQNPQMTGESLHLIDVMEDMLEMDRLK